MAYTFSALPQGIVHMYSCLKVLMLLAGKCMCTNHPSTILLPSANDLTSFLEDAVQTNPTTSTKRTDTSHDQFDKTSAPLLSGTSAQPKIASPEHSRSEHAVKVDLIEMDETSRDIFGEDGLAELNAALMELSTIQSGFGFKSPG